MEKPIKCSDSYNPYKVLDKVLQVFVDYAFEFVVHKDGVAMTEPVFGAKEVIITQSDAYVYCFGSGMLSFKIRNNPYNDKLFNVDIDHAEHGILYLRGNLELKTNDQVENLINIIKNTLHKYKDDLGEAQRRVVMINSIIE